MTSFEQMTQGQMNYLLERLGYCLTMIENGPYRWENSQHDAVMLLPALSPECPARPHHLQTLRHIAIGKGIVEPEEFDALMQEARQHQPESLVAAHNAA